MTFQESSKVIKVDLFNLRVIWSVSKKNCRGAPQSFPGRDVHAPWAEDTQEGSFYFLSLHYVILNSVELILNSFN